MKEEIKAWKILELLKVTEGLFREKKIDNPRLNAELILSSILKSKRIDLYLDFEKPLSEAELSQFREKVKRRLNREPLQYIIGETEFYGLKFKVNPSVLIPRTETELLVDKALEILIHNRLENPKILEIGTGSGCIAISITSRLKCTIDAIDTSDDALKTAKLNSDFNNTTRRVNFIKKNILSDFSNFNEYDLVISNPPYIEAGEIQTLADEIKNFEPMKALTDNAGGLVFYRKFIEIAKNTQGKVRLLLEIGDNKKEKVENLLRESKIQNFEFFKDLLNIYRVVYIEL
ncbi:MAG: peptide chain release factor N(5)-glutamine methyltransferase [Chlorobi bacterium]|nr:peptide chain release factor N(5)-glutamine methyltransferase [Chlorobiota bacterium]MCI0716682.1 peptide chain release factor N(5)-glutamine methyltransferase [Chlorobiota bacterium]